MATSLTHDDLQSGERELGTALNEGEVAEEDDYSSGGAPPPA
jgi:hypothetical protein